MKGTISHKESLPSQRIVKRRKIEVVSEAVESTKGGSESVGKKEKRSLSAITKEVDEDKNSSLSETDSDDDLQLEQQRLQQLRETKVRENPVGESQNTNWNYDILFQNKHRKEKKVQDIRNDKQESVTYKRFMKNLFK